MATYRIGVIVGSLRRESYNARLARALAQLAPPALHLEGIPIGTLPLYDQDLDAHFPAEALRFKEAVRGSDGILFVTPEYNRSIPGVLKNAIDWGSRPYGDSAWVGKPAAIAGISPGAISTAVAQQHLKGIVAALDMPLLAQPEIFLHFTEGLIGPAGEVENAGTRALLQGFLARYAAWVQRFAHPAG